MSGQTRFLKLINKKTLFTSTLLSKYTIICTVLVTESKNIYNNKKNGYRKHCWKTAK